MSGLRCGKHGGDAHAQEQATMLAAETAGHAIAHLTANGRAWADVQSVVRTSGHILSEAAKCAIHPSSRAALPAAVQPLVHLATSPEPSPSADLPPSSAASPSSLRRTTTSVFTSTYPQA